MDRFFYIITDSQQNVLVLRSYSYPSKSNYILLKSSLQQTLLDDNLLRLSFQSTKIELVADLSALVPAPLFEPDKVETYLQHLSKVDPINKVHNELVAELDIHNVYAFNLEIYSLLKTYFPRAEFYHMGTSLLKAFHALTKHQTGEDVYLNVMQGSFQAIVFRSKELILYNTFFFRSTKDFLYYVMLIYDQLGLNQEKVPLNISGELLEDSEVYQLVYKYTRNIHFIKRPHFYRFSDKFSHIPEHFYYDLYSLKLCG